MPGELYGNIEKATVIVYSVQGEVGAIVLALLPDSDCSHPVGIIV